MKYSFEVYIGRCELSIFRIINEDNHFTYYIIAFLMEDWICYCTDEEIKPATNAT